MLAVNKKLIGGLCLLICVHARVGPASDAPLPSSDRKTATQPLIAYGDSAKPEQFPFAAFLIFGKSIVCSGSLISPRVVLTAAHCLLDFSKFEAFKKEDIDIYLGSIEFGRVGTKYSVKVRSCLTMLSIHVAKNHPHAVIPPNGAIYYHIIERPLITGIILFFYRIHYCA